MSGVQKYRPELRFLSFCRKIQIAIAGEEASEDRRMTEAQRHAAVLKVLGCEPVIMDAKLIHLTMDKRSDFYRAVPLPLVHRWLMDLHDRINPAPDRNTRKRDDGENQFELNFEWQNGTAMMSEAAE
jgi:hypothetical protein